MLADLAVLQQSRIDVYLLRDPAHDQLWAVISAFCGLALFGFRKWIALDGSRAASSQIG